MGMEEMMPRIAGPANAERVTEPVLPPKPTGIEKALAEFVNDADMLGTTLPGYVESGFAGGCWCLAVGGNQPGYDV